MFGDAFFQLWMLLYIAVNIVTVLTVIFFGCFSTEYYCMSPNNSS